ncbi:CinA family protein [Stappia indica]|uniref:Nicotinamide-nucleotide amidohydrolase family protein n=1 Tax=Stappia indica TaxID=538381 RepID=A0A857C323_9HYPH|nr:CinA family protein [Stappia indica]QGZ33284.1 nicotinamide-nucleotide amidohydrolase family protein [Stappia indica]
MTDLARVEDSAACVIREATAAGLLLTTAESCTGGLIAGALTEISGSSAAVDRGFVTYSNEAKSDMLGVPADLIARVGAVSRDVAIAMAEGALAASRADVTVAVTGIAGPGGGSAEKPVGLVHMALSAKGLPTHHEELRLGDAGRSAVRLATVERALAALSQTIAKVLSVRETGE